MNLVQFGDSFEVSMFKSRGHRTVGIPQNESLDAVSCSDLLYGQRRAH